MGSQPNFDRCRANPSIRKAPLSVEGGKKYVAMSSFRTAIVVIAATKGKAFLNPPEHPRFEQQHGHPITRVFVPVEVTLSGLGAQQRSPCPNPARLGR